jgi:tetratricopeptide (TPR) repeat protein
MFKRNVLCTLITISSLRCIPHVPINMENLESQLQLLNSPQAAMVEWDSVAQQCLIVAQDFLNTYYNYHSAITWFERAVALYEKEVHSHDSKSCILQSYIGLAMSYHHIGKHIQRDRCMSKAQHLLTIPDNPNDYTQEMFDRAAANYFVVDAYRFYIRYENCHKNSGSIEQQEGYLNRAKDAFYKAFEIADTFDQALEKTHAQHGLGTVFEFLGKCQQERGNLEGTKIYLHQAVNAFEYALTMRKQSLGETHPHVARSYHKLARNYALLGGLLKQDFYSKADGCYQKAIAIFEHNNISKDQAKRQELENEYQLFKQMVHDH